ncbi:MAG: four helix bundle protein [Cyclobacteriaceae bacterium]|nr:four helix bundle protein [Cyclobacteriaceae bacterium]
MHNLKELKIWQKAVDLATEVYRLTSEFPKEEKYGLTSQIRRSVVSISSNIAEGAGRNSDKEFAHFLGISNGSSYELQTQLLISKNLGLASINLEDVLDQIDQIQKMNYSLQQKLNQN